MHRNTLFSIAIVSTTLFSLISCSGSSDHSSETATADSTVAPAAPNVIGQEVTYEADSITMKGYLAYDASIEGKRPGVIVVHEWWGHNEHTRNAADKLAKEGYVAFALDMYGDGKTAEHPEDAGAFAGAVMQNFDGAQARFNAALKVLIDDAHSDPEHLAAIGYCFGGGVVLNMARQGAELDAVATFHGSIGPIEPAQPGVVNARLLVMNGKDDPFVSADAIASFKAEMDSAGVEYEFVNYPGAVHAFTNPAATEKGKKFELPLAYNKEADEKSWAKLLAFLAEVF
ncbi:MAG: dienelactone hydrolase family protein [Flavobacteriales bacterium]|nr:dienelactone hydrolase family protein [Flavobacteriales bacterium]